eukprot:TRINITY_DN135646_c0_g1_i1.p4 TRINITY_DN135646_c0_g1~~TRINITY_DN135646_c0_g1_i1.p4  ORF type:complete len:267 (+),score=19.06 TRINITY_DN135646_c0_g1_i1:1984-2784(+)
MQQLVDQLLDDTEGYREVKSNENLVVNIKSGSILDKNVIIMKGDIRLSAKYGINNVVNTLAEPEGREKWDSSLIESHILKIYNKWLLLKRYIVKIPMIFMQNREFIEKQVVFRSREKVYMYSTSVDDSFEPIKPDLTRSRTFISANRVTKVEDRIKVESISQMDLKLPLPVALVSGKMAEGLEKYRVDLIKKLDTMIQYLLVISYKNKENFYKQMADQVLLKTHMEIGCQDAGLQQRYCKTVGKSQEKLLGSHGDNYKTTGGKTRV